MNLLKMKISVKTKKNEEKCYSFNYPNFIWS